MFLVYTWKSVRSRTLNWCNVHDDERYSQPTLVSWPSLSLDITSMSTPYEVFVQKERHRPWGFALYTGLNIDTDSWGSMEQQYITCPGKEIKAVSIYIRIYIWGRLQKMKILVWWLVGLFFPKIESHEGLNESLVAEKSNSEKNRGIVHEKNR